MGEKKVFNVKWLREDFLKTFRSDMEKRNITRTELATRLSVSRSRVSQMLSMKHSNITVKTMARMTRALRMKLAIVAYEGR